MEGGFQKSLQLFVANEYCVFKDDACADLSGVLDGKPNYAYSSFSDEGPDYATALLSEFCARAKYPPMLAPSRVAMVKVYG